MCQGPAAGSRGELVPAQMAASNATLCRRVRQLEADSEFLGESTCVTGLQAPSSERYELKDAGKATYSIHGQGAGSGPIGLVRLVAHGRLPRLQAWVVWGARPSGGRVTRPLGTCLLGAADSHRASRPKPFSMGRIRI